MGCGVGHLLTFLNGDLAGTCKGLWRLYSIPTKTGVEEWRKRLGLHGAVVSVQSWRVHLGIANIPNTNLCRSEKGLLF